MRSTLGFSVFSKFSVIFLGLGWTMIGRHDSPRHLGSICLVRLRGLLGFLGRLQSHNPIGRWGGWSRRELSTLSARARVKLDMAELNLSHVYAGVN
jgi:hypothetical protein